ncbi:MAG: molybdopterin-synthase adenylyltransferase MoeB [Aureispira sp.]
MEWTKQELERYSRHLRLDQIGATGQARLKAAKVLVIGAGGLGCPTLQYLAAAGVGTIGIIDGDVLDLSNLQRQILYATSDVGEYKAVAAKRRLEALNPLLTVQIYPYELTKDNALELMQMYDIVVDGSDNFATRYLVNDASVITETPLVYGSIFKFEGQVAVFNYKNGPSYRCLFPSPPAVGQVPNCSEIGVLGVLPGIIGSMQANEVLKIILGIGTVLSGQLLVYNTLDCQSLLLDIAPNPVEIAATKRKAATLHLQDYEAFCGLVDNKQIEELSAETLADTLSKYTIVDVRELWEQPEYEELEGIKIPLPRLLTQASRVPTDRPVVVVCAKGIRSRIAIEQLQEKLGYTNLKNLTGGIKAWEKYLQQQEV